MKLERAIKHLERKVKQNVFQVDPEALEALKLSIQASKRLQDYRHQGLVNPDRLLLGETKD